MTKTSVKIIWPLLALALFLPLSAKAFTDSMAYDLATIWLWCGIIGLFGVLLLGLFLVLVVKDKILVLTDDMVARPGIAIGHGALVLLVGPFVLLSLAMTMIGIPLAFVLGLFWILLMIMGKMLVAILAGLLLMGRYRHKRAKNGTKTETTGNMILVMIIGVTVTLALFIIPIFGWILAIIAEMWGMGVLWLATKKNCCSK